MHMSLRPYVLVVVYMGIILNRPRNCDHYVNDELMRIHYDEHTYNNINELHNLIIKNKLDSLMIARANRVKIHHRATI